MLRKFHRKFGIRNSEFGIGFRNSELRTPNSELSWILRLFRLHSRQTSERGFILPLSVLLVIVLAISGTSFMQHDYLERRMVMNNVDNHTAFYLANAGIERARATMKISNDVTAGLTWTPTLQPTDPAFIDSDLSSPVHQLLCGREPCIIPPFGAIVDAPDFPFDGTFDRGQYSVRAFDNFEATEGEKEEDQDWDTDTDQRITLRAVGLVGNEQKVIEATIFATSSLKMINCDEDFDSNLGAPNGTCPTSYNCAGGAGGNDCVKSDLPGRDPGSFDPDQLPKPQPGFYNNKDSFPGLAGATFIAPNDTIEIKPGRQPLPLGLAENTYYYFDAREVIIYPFSTTANNVIVYVTGRLTIKSNTLNQTVLIGNGITLDGGVDLKSSPPFPALISMGGGITANGAINIEGNIWSSGQINLNAQNMRGTITGINGKINLNVGNMEDHPQFSQDLIYYEPMRGFNYPLGQISPGIAPGTWREIE